ESYLCMVYDGCQPSVDSVCSDAPNFVYRAGGIKRTVLNTKSTPNGKSNGADHTKGGNGIEGLDCGGFVRFVYRRKGRWGWIVTVPPFGKDHGGQYSHSEYLGVPQIPNMP